MEKHDLENDPIIQALASPENDANTRKLIKKALCVAVMRGNFDDDVIEILVNALTPHQLALFCNKLLFGNKNEKEYSELAHGGRVLQVMKILQFSDIIKNKRNGIKYLDNIMADVDTFRVNMVEDVRQGKMVCYRNAHFLNSIYNHAAHDDNTKYAHERQMTKWMMDKCPNLDTDEEEVAFENIYEVRSENINSYNSEQFWANYEKITGITENY